VTVHKAITICNFPRRVPLADIHSAILSFHIAYTDGAGQSIIKVTLAYTNAGAGTVTALPELVTLKVKWISSKMAMASRFQMRGLETIFTTRRNGWGPDNSIKAHEYLCVHFVDLRTVTQRKR